jgi:hypothetical protein
MSTKPHSIKIICDNGGSLTLQLPGFAHYYQDPAQAAEDLAAYMATDSTDGWEGHEEDAEDCDPTSDEIANGGYSVYSATSLDEVRDELLSMEQSGWANAESFAAAMRAKLA